MRITTRLCVLCISSLVLLCVVDSSCRAAGAKLRFRTHAVNPDSTYSASAAVDVDRDGKLDIVCGGYWYQAPHWKRHFLREVETIRGRYDDYSNLPLDVNGDGWTDLVSCNYRSQKIYWIEHPGASLGAWKAHQIARPGASETGRLVDIDGDGQLDLLPNGVKYAAWWALRKPAQAGGDPNWRRYELPVEIAGHGIGFGDLNGDGRGDLVGPAGWLEAPQDRRAGRWIWRPEFRLHRDVGLPALVMDVDGDGDSDIIWGRGHNIGLYWLEQIKTDGRRSWQKHVIDTSWSQLHSLLLADLDNDGQVEVIAGKRYMGHDGKDIGEYDPLCAYWYRYLPKTRSWQRGQISFGGAVGYGLDPKAIDLDADGDIDLLASGRSGLFWVENLLVDKQGKPSQPVAETPTDEYNHAELLVYRHPKKGSQTVESHASWALRRADILAGMVKAMGPLPNPTRRVPLDVKIQSEETSTNYTRRKLTYASEPGDRVPALLLVPHKPNGRAMLCLHQTTRIGKGEPAGLGGKSSLQYAHELANRGYTCLAPDYPSFGDYAYNFADDDYQSGSMKAIWNNLRAVDLLESLPDVHPDRIGCIGHSLGGHNSLFTAAFDQRIRAVVTSCGFTAFHHYYGGKLAGWTSDRYMPRIRDQYANDPDQVPFDFYEVIAALAPRAIFVNAPLSDGNFEVAGVKKVMGAAAKVYAITGGADRVKAVYPDVGHDFPENIRKEAYDWLDRMLN